MANYLGILLQIYTFIILYHLLYLLLSEVNILVSSCLSICVCVHVCMCVHLCSFNRVHLTCVDVNKNRTKPPTGNSISETSVTNTSNDDNVVNINGKEKKTTDSKLQTKPLV